MKQLNSLGCWKSTLSFWVLDLLVLIPSYSGRSAQAGATPNTCAAIDKNLVPNLGVIVQGLLTVWGNLLFQVFLFFQTTPFARSLLTAVKDQTLQKFELTTSKVINNCLKNHLPTADCLQTDIVIEYKRYAFCNAGCRGLAHAWTTGIHPLGAPQQIQGRTGTSHDSSTWLNIITRNVHSVLGEEKWAVLCVPLPAWEMWMSTRVVF